MIVHTFMLVVGCGVTPADFCTGAGFCTGITGTGVTTPADMAGGTAGSTEGCPAGLKVTPVTAGDAITGDTGETVTD